MCTRRDAARRVTLAGLVGGLLLAGTACGPSVKPKATTTETKVDEGIPEPDQEAQQIAAIAKAINEFSPAVHTCWARGAADDFHLEGRVVLSVEIAADGPSTVRVSEETVDDALLLDCLVQLWADYRWPEVFAAGDTIVLPPFEFVAPDAQYSVASAHVATHSLADDKLQVQVLLDKANTGNGSAALSYLTIRDGLEVGLHSHDSVEILFLMSGSGRLTGAAGNVELTPGSAVYVPKGSVHGFVQTGSEPAEFLQLYAPGGAEARFKDPSHSEGTTPHTGPIPKRGPKPIVRKALAVDAYDILGGKGQVRLMFDLEDTGPSEGAYIGALTAQPQAAVPPHRHAESSEYLFIIEGQGEMRVSGQELFVQPGDAIQIPANVEHSVTVVGTEPLKALQFYRPAGPEQRFKGKGK